MPLTPQPGVDVHAGEAVAGGGELTLEGLAPHLAVVDHRQANFLLHGDDLADRPVLGRLEPGRREHPLRVGFAGIAQELRAEQAPHVLHPRIDCHNAQRPTPGRAHSPGPRPDVTPRRRGALCAWPGRAAPSQAVAPPRQPLAWAGAPAADAYWR